MITIIDPVTGEETTTSTCPYCGSHSGGSSGAPHGCASVATTVTKLGKVVYAPTARECAQCGSKEHRNLSQNERNIICAWQQFTNEVFPGAFVKNDRYGVPTEFAPIDAAKALQFGEWMATGAFKVKPKKVRTPAAPKPLVNVPETATPMAAAIAQDVNADPPVVHAPPKPPRKSKKQLLEEEILRQAEAAK